MTTQARGTFDVQLHPLTMEDIAKEAMLGRMSIDKQFHGDLEATSKGEFLSAMGSVNMMTSGVIRLLKRAAITK